MQKKTEMKPSVMPNEPNNRDLVHFYKKGQEWFFVSQEKYTIERDNIPLICFATRHPIKDFSNIKDNTSFLPNLEEIIARGIRANKDTPF